MILPLKLPVRGLRAEVMWRRQLRDCTKLRKIKKKRTIRAQKWRSNMLKTFADVDVKSIDSEVLSRGREYIDMLKKNKGDQYGIKRYR